ncbi:MAG TPA: hypothetical protein DCS93_09135 [Microscillaceae bacterium]|nr:hypothetical protein [Microscillaceae bacterium]
MDILETTGIQLKNEFLVKNGFRHAEFKSKDLVKLFGLKGDVVELTYELKTFNKVAQEYQLGHSTSFLFKNDKSIASVLHLYNEGGVRAKFDYLSYRDDRVSQITKFLKTGEQDEITTFDYDEFSNLLRLETKGKTHSSAYQFAFQKSESGDSQYYVYRNGHKTYRDRLLIKTHSSGAKESVTIHYYYSDKGNLIKTIKRNKDQFRIKKVETIYNEHQESVEIKSETLDRKTKKVRAYDQLLEYNQDGNLISHTTINDEKTEYTTFYKYDSLGYLTEIWEDNALNQQKQLAELVYDEQNNLVCLHYFQNSWKWDITYKYDEYGNWIEREIQTHDGGKDKEKRKIKYATQQ